MKTINKIILAMMVSIGSYTIQAQQAAMYTHYMYNTLVVNPGYAGSRDALTVTLLHRSQWVDFQGAPTTQSLTMHTPLRNEHIGLGLSVLNDKIGPSNNTAAIFDFAYIVKLSANSKLALGLSAEAKMYKANLNTLLLDQQTDPLFQTNLSNEFKPNVGFGAYYSREKFYAGVSVPNLLEPTYAINNPNTEGLLIGKEQRHYFFIAGALFDISNNFAFKPTTLFKLTPSAPIQADFTVNCIIMQRLLLGAMVRSGDGVGALVGFDVTQQLHVGYSFDWSLGLSTAKYNKGSHEIVLRYDFMNNSKKQIHSPRNF